LAEYLEDYAKPEIVEKGWRIIEKNMNELGEPQTIEELKKRLEQIKSGKRDLYF